MSIILDSLKRAERERRVGDTPAVDTLYEEKPASAGSPKPKRRWLAGLLLVNLVVVGLLALALYQRQPVPKAAAPQAQPTSPKAVESRDVVQPPPPPTDKELSASAAVKKGPPTPPAPEARKAPMPPDPPAPPKETVSPGDVRFGPPVAVAEDDLKAETSIDPPPVPFNPATKTAVQTTNAGADQPSTPETLARTTPPAGQPAMMHGSTRAGEKAAKWESGQLPGTASIPTISSPQTIIPNGCSRDWKNRSVFLKFLFPTRSPIEA